MPSQASACRRPAWRAAYERDREAFRREAAMNTCPRLPRRRRRCSRRPPRRTPTRRSSSSMHRARCGARSAAKPRSRSPGETLAARAPVGARRSRTRLHGLWPSRQGKLRRHRADRAAGGRAPPAPSPRRRTRCTPKGKTPISDAVQAGGRESPLHRGEGDRDPHHRRPRDLRRRPLRGRDANSKRPVSTSPPMSSASA